MYLHAFLDGRDTPPQSALYYLPAIEQLEQALDTFEGTVVLVTHDRDLLERVRLTRTLDLDRGTVSERR